MKQKGKGIRSFKIAEEIRRHVEQSTLKSPAWDHISNANRISVTKVLMSDDLSCANVYLYSYAQDIDMEQAVKDINDNHKQLNKYISQNMYLKFLPKLRFYLDHNIEYAAHINHLIDNAK